MLRNEGLPCTCGREGSRQLGHRCWELKVTRHKWQLPVPDQRAKPLGQGHAHPPCLGEQLEPAVQRLALRRGVAPAVSLPKQCQQHEANEIPACKTTSADEGSEAECSVWVAGGECSADDSESMTSMPKGCLLLAVCVKTEWLSSLSAVTDEEGWAGEGFFPHLCKMIFGVS